jgi:hypothetical protein
MENPGLPMYLGTYPYWSFGLYEQPWGTSVVDDLNGPTAHPPRPAFNLFILSISSFVSIYYSPPAEH